MSPPVSEVTVAVVDPPAPAPAPASEITPDAARTVMVEIPLALSAGRASRDLNYLDARDARTLKDIAAALNAEGKKLENGRSVVNENDALAWMLQKIREG